MTALGPTRICDTLLEWQARIRAELAALDARAEKYFAAFARHRDKCPVCSRGATTIAGNDVLCTIGDFKRSNWARAEQQYLDDLTHDTLTRRRWCRARRSGRSRTTEASS